MEKPDMTFVAPHRREEVLRRIEVLESYKGGPKTKTDAVAAATRLGIGLSQFYVLLKSWVALGRPELLAGASAPRARRTNATNAQIRLIERARRSAAGASSSTIAALALARAARAGIPMPSARTIRKIIEMDQIGIPPRTLPPNADIVLLETVIDIPVRADVATGAAMPIATLLIALHPVEVVAVALSMERGDAVAARRAINGAMRSGHLIVPKTIAIPDADTPEWTDLTMRLADAGFRVQQFRMPGTRTLNPAVHLIGRKPVGLRLVPGLNDKPAAQRRSTRHAGDQPIDISEAERVVAARLVRGNMTPDGQSRG